MIRKAIFLGGRYNGKREMLEPVRNIERDGDTYTSMSSPFGGETVVYVLSGATTKVEQLLISEVDRLDRELGETKEYVRRLMKETERLQKVS